MDHKGEELFRGELVTCKIEWSPLLKGQISLRTISILDSHIQLYKEKENLPYNFQFIIDAFKSEKPTSPKRLNLSINSIILRRCNISYNELYKIKKEDRFDISHINIEDLNTNISLRKLTPDSLNLRIRSFSMREQSGLQINNLALRMTANKTLGHINKLELNLPNSHIEEKNLTATYNAVDLQTLLKTFTLRGTLDNTYLATNDFGFLIPQLKNTDETFNLFTNLDISPNQILLNRINIDNRNHSFSLSSDITFDRKDGKITNIFADINKLDIDYPLIKKAISSFLPQSSNNKFEGIGYINFNGKVNYNVAQKAQITGIAKTLAGSLKTNIIYDNKKIRGNVLTTDFSPSQLLNKESLPHLVNIDLKGEFDLQQEDNPQLWTELLINELHHKHTTYSGIHATSEWKNKRLQFQIDSESPHLKFSAQGVGRFDGKRLSNFKSTCNLTECNPKELNWTKRFSAANFSSFLSLYIKEIKKGLPYGDLEIQDFKMKSPADEYVLNNLELQLSPADGLSELKMHSDFATIYLKGDLAPNSIKRYGDYLVAHYFADSIKSQNINTKDLKDWHLSAQIKKTDILHKLLNFPLSTSGTFSIEGNLQPQKEYLYLSSYCQGMNYDNIELLELRLFLQGKEKQLISLVQAKKPTAQSQIQVSLSNNLLDNNISTHLLWDDGDKHKNKGEISINTIYDPASLNDKKELAFTTNIRPTSITISDSVWHIAPGKIQYAKDRLLLNNIAFNHDKQHLSLNGIVSQNLGDSLHIKLNKINLAYVLGLIKFKAVEFSGYVSGEGNLIGYKDSINGHALLDVDDFKFNNSPMGPTKVIGRWNSIDKNIELDADMGVKGQYTTQVKGYISPVNKALDLHIKSYRTDIRFLNKYVSGIFKDLKGHTTGELRLFGPFKKLDFMGDEKIDMTTELLATGVRYNITNGQLKVHPGHFDFKDVTISDYLGQTGIVNGGLQHNHLKNLRYNFNVNANNLLVYDKEKNSDMPFYATIYGTGNISIDGGGGALQADVSITPTSQSKLVYILDNPDNFGEVKFVTFRDKSQQPATTNISESNPRPIQTQSAPLDLKLNFLVNMNPSAELQVIMDERSGDNIKIYGNGPIRANWYNKGEFNMFGTLNVERGSYKMSIQEVIRKNFEFSPGGRIVFAGNPYNADLDLKAIYTVNSASLSDLNIGSGFNEGPTRADCILKIKGKTNSPQISFELDLPNVNEEEKQMVKNLLSTEEDLNMQVLYLLGIGRFYTYDYASAENANQSQSSVAMKSFLSNTLSNQLNDIISNAIGSSNWTFGTNLSTGQTGWSDMEVEGLIRGRLLNNRLLINGNFGYHDRPTMSTNFVGDFDVSYLITPSGGVSLKAYSETNDRYFSKSSLTTQGIGLQLKRDFYNLKDLFSVRGTKKKTEQSNTAPSTGKPSK